jgi:IstB-like ATP binding protein
MLSSDIRNSPVFGSERLTGALLDRLTHHVHILEMNGDSYRLKPTFPGFLPFERDFPSHRAASQRNSIATDSVHGHFVGLPAS